MAEHHPSGTSTEKCACYGVLDWSSARMDAGSPPRCFGVKLSARDGDYTPSTVDLSHIAFFHLICPGKTVYPRNAGPKSAPDCQTLKVCDSSLWQDSYVIVHLPVESNTIFVSVKCRLCFKEKEVRSPNAVCRPPMEVLVSPHRIIPTSTPIQSKNGCRARKLMSTGALQDPRVRKRAVSGNAFLLSHLSFSSEYRGRSI